MQEQLLKKSRTTFQVRLTDKSAIIAFTSRKNAMTAVAIPSEYVAAKSVVSSYYGTADGDAHTVSVSDLSDSGVHKKSVTAHHQLPTAI